MAKLLTEGAWPLREAPSQGTVFVSVPLVHTDNIGPFIVLVFRELSVFEVTYDLQLRYRGILVMKSFFWLHL